MLVQCTALPVAVPAPSFGVDPLLENMNSILSAVAVPDTAEGQLAEIRSLKDTIDAQIELIGKIATVKTRSCAFFNKQGETVFALERFNPSPPLPIPLECR